VSAVGLTVTAGVRLCVGAAKVRQAEMRVDLGCGKRCVAEEFLDCA
jgi:hypothetical protein